MIYLTRRERFNAAHRVYREEWSDKKNQDVFGMCSNPKWHGHNYVLFVTIRGEVQPELGYVVDLKVLSRIIRERIIDKLDHKNINLEVDFMHGKMASTEQIAIAIWEELEPHIQALGVDLYRIRLEETENNFVEYFGN
ncbi:MAG: 6-pyruvoyl tetrahydrobiopterin synthase [Bacteroides sp. SM23_62]|nr:MAG: 6-pyruvoyl tetrahydrobiopterin synthase [Bacteroides sp. SM23_62]